MAKITKNKEKNLEKNFISKFLNIFWRKENNNPKYQALKITFIYFFIGSLWILLSDKLVDLLISDPETRFIVAIVKGWFYVSITAIIVFILIYTEMKEIIDSKEKIQDINAMLEEKIQEKTQIENELNEGKIFMESIFNSVPGLVYLYNDQYKLVRWNKKHNEMTGFSDEELKGKSILDWYKDDEKNQEGILKTIEIAVKNGFGEIEIDMPIKDKTKIPMFFTISPVKIENKLYFTGIGLDMTQKNQLNERLEKYKILAEKSNDVILFLDKQGNILEANDAAIRTYGYTYEEFKKISVFNLRHVEKDSKVIEQMERADKLGIIFETTHYLKDGTPIPVEVSSQGTFIGDKRILLSIVRNISERKKAEKDILYLSYHDQLTGLYNRRFYEEEIRRLNTEINIPLALIIADVNGLKLTNDAFGHITGDSLLQKIAIILVRECPSNGTISRIGGDEFVILLPKTSEYEAEEIIKRIKFAIKGEKTENVVLSASIGVAVKNSNFEDIDEIFKRAEADMYRYKLTESSIMRRQTIDLIMNSLYERSSVELNHGKRVSEICEAIGTAMGFEKEHIEQIKIAGLMHDIGKITINENIINKPEESLNQDEWYEIKRHSEVGYQILRSVNEFSQIANYVLEHHERWDGSGYPKGLKGEEISVEGRIIAIANAYTAMTSDKIYSKALDEEIAINELKKFSGSQFDPRIVEIFLEKVLGKN